MKELSPLAAHFRFWLPPNGYSVKTGAELNDFELPIIPMPILKSVLDTGAPSDHAIGNGLYDYLRQFPNCPYNSEYAALLRDAWPHYIADLAAMIMMLDHKEVDAPYIRRKITGMQILLLLEPHNSGLQRQLGIAFYDLSLNFMELCECRSHLTKSIHYFSAAAEQLPGDPTILSHMAQIDYLLGDYPNAIKRWHKLVGLVSDDGVRAAIISRMNLVSSAVPPRHPLLVDLESVGEAMRLLAEGASEEAKTILERLEQEQVITTELPSPEFYSLLAISRERSGDLSGAQAAFAQALELEPSHQESLDGIDRLQRG